MTFERAVLCVEARTDLTMMPIPESPAWLTKPPSYASFRGILRKPAVHGELFILPVFSLKDPEAQERQEMLPCITELARGWHGTWISVPWLHPLSLNHMVRGVLQECH